jgi:hypothetical protein
MRHKIKTLFFGHKCLENLKKSPKNKAFGLCLPNWEALRL